MTGNEFIRREAVHHPRSAGEEPEQIGADGDLVDRGANRLARIRRLETAELVGVGLERIGDLEHDQAAILGRRLAPRLERLVGRLDRPVDVLVRRRRHFRYHLAVGRILDVQRLA